MVLGSHYSFDASGRSFLVGGDELGEIFGEIRETNREESLVNPLDLKQKIRRRGLRWYYPWSILS